MNLAPRDDESLITGSETVEELHDFISRISIGCPLGRVHSRCPFNMFGLLDPQVRQNLIQGMSIEACKHFFELELECRAKPD